MRILAVGLFCAACSFTIFAQTNFNLRQAATFDARIENSDFYNGNQIGFSSDENLFFAIDRKSQKLTVWEIGSLTQKYSLSGKFEEAEFSPDGKRLAIISRKEITILDVETGETHANVNKYKDEVEFLGWNPNSENFAVGTKDSRLDILDGVTGKLKNSIVVCKRKRDFFDKILDIGYYPRVIFTPDGKKFLTFCQEDTAAKFWDLETGKVIDTFTLKPTPSYLGMPSTDLPGIWYAEISADGRWILTGNYSQNRLWKAETGNLVEEFSGFSRPSFSPDSYYLGMITDSTAKEAETAVFDLYKREIKTILPKYSGEVVAWSPDDRIFVTDQTNNENSQKKAYIWETETGKQLAEIKTYAKYCFDFVSTCISDSDRFSFSPNGEVLMSQNKKEIKFLNPQNGEIIFRANDSVSPAVWSPSGHFLLSKAKEKGKILLFDVSY